MNTKISEKEAAASFGITTNHELMPNGERRFRLVDERGLGYIRTEAGNQGYWQNGHFHRSITETYIVQSGWIAVATLNAQGDVEMRKIERGETWTAPMFQAHTVFMSAGAVTHVVKHGDGSSADWNTSEDTETLDFKTKAMDEGKVLVALASASRAPKQETA